LWVEQALRENKGLDVPPIVAGARPEAIPLSFAQERLWFLDQFEPASTTYLLPTALHMHGVCQIGCLEQSLQTLIHRHESLRTTFQMREGHPVQVIHPTSLGVLALIDLQGIEPEQREALTRRLAGQEREHPCDLAKGPLLRTRLLRLSPQLHVLLLTLHHIITDGWSNAVFMRELTTLYQERIEGLPCSLPSLPLQYADYAIFQRAFLAGEVLERQLAYWSTQLTGLE